MAKGGSARAQREPGASGERPRVAARTRLRRVKRTGPPGFEGTSAIRPACRSDWRARAACALGSPDRRTTWSTVQPSDRPASRRARSWMTGVCWASTSCAAATGSVRIAGWLARASGSSRAMVSSSSVDITVAQEAADSRALGRPSSRAQISASLRSSPSPAWKPGRRSARRRRRKSRAGACAGGTCGGSARRVARGDTRNLWWSETPWGTRAVSRTLRRGHSRMRVHTVSRRTRPWSLPSRTSSEARSPICRASLLTPAPSPTSRSAMAACSGPRSKSSCSRTQRTAAEPVASTAPAAAAARCVLPTPGNPDRTVMRCWSSSNCRVRESSSRPRPTRGRARTLIGRPRASKSTSSTSPPAESSKESRSSVVSASASARSRTVSRRGAATRPSSRLRTARTLTVERSAKVFWLS